MYFTQAEIKCYLEDVLKSEVFMVGPGVAFVFADDTWQQGFESARYIREGISKRLVCALQSRTLRVRTPGPEASVRSSRSQHQLSAHRVLLDRIWSAALDLGRFPETDEIDFISDVEVAVGTLKRALILMAVFYDLGLLAQARTARVDDIKVYLAAQQFQKRAKYRNIEPRLQKDIKSFFACCHADSPRHVVSLLPDSPTGSNLREAIGQHE